MLHGAHIFTHLLPTAQQPLVYPPIVLQHGFARVSHYSISIVNIVLVLLIIVAQVIGRQSVTFSAKSLSVMVNMWIVHLRNGGHALTPQTDFTVVTNSTLGVGEIGKAFH